MASDYGSFYFTLPSNSSLKVFPNNTLTSYTTMLPDVMELNGDYEVGLSEIHYPHNWNTIHAKDTWKITILEVIQKEQEGQSFADQFKPYNIELSKQSFVDIKHLIDTCNDKIKEKMFGKMFDVPSIIWDANAHCVIINNTVQEQGEAPMIRTLRLISFSPELRNVLGFQNTTYKDGGTASLRYIGSQSVSQRNFFDQIYVYSDICEEQYVGDIKASLLRVVPIKGGPGDVISIIYEKPQYVPVVKNRLQTIQILLRTDTGQPIQFFNGRVVVTLHFRRRRPTF